MSPTANPASGPGEGEGRESLPAPGFAEVRIVAASPETARMIAQVLRMRFAATEQRSYPAGDTGDGTRLALTVDTVHIPQASGPFQLRLVGGDHERTRTHGVVDAPGSPEPEVRDPDPGTAADPATATAPEPAPGGTPGDRTRP